MASTIRDLLSFIVRSYPHKGDLSKGRVTKLVYLSDWRHALTEGCQITPIRWKFDNFGPFVWDVYETAVKYEDLFVIRETTNMFGTDKTLILASDEDHPPNLKKSEKAAARHVIKTTSQMNWDDFIGLVYSTYPVLASERYTYLDLVALSKEYKKTEIYQGRAAFA